MEPNYKRSSALAMETAARFGAVSSSGDLLRILRGLPGVYVVSLDMNHTPGSDAWDAFTCVREKAGVLQFIVMYNPSLPSHTLRHVLARELGHIILEHDGLAQEDVWMQEADCFAYHLLAYRPLKNVTVYYRPGRRSLSASFKDMMTFDSMDALKQSVADDHTRRSYYIGRKTIIYHPSDVKIVSLGKKDIFGGWENYSSVIVAGQPVGFCGVHKE